jgi:hypothetical protein
MSALLHFLIILLEACFAIGVIGSFLVLVLTTIEDVQELFGGEKKIHE